MNFKLNEEQRELLSLIPESMKKLKLNNSTKLILADIILWYGTEHAKNNGFMYRTNKDFMKDTGLRSEHTVIIAVNKLQSLGLINREIGKRKAASIYTLNEVEMKKYNFIIKATINCSEIDCNNLDQCDNLDCNKSKIDCNKSKIDCNNLDCNNSDYYSDKLNYNSDNCSETIKRLVLKINELENRVRQLECIIAVQNNSNNSIDCNNSEKNYCSTDIDKDIEKDIEIYNTLNIEDYIPYTLKEKENIDNILYSNTIKEKPQEIEIMKSTDNHNTPDTTSIEEIIKKETEVSITDTPHTTSTEDNKKDIEGTDNHNNTIPMSEDQKKNIEGSDTDTPDTTSTEKEEIKKIEVSSTATSEETTPHTIPTEKKRKKIQITVSTYMKKDDKQIYEVCMFADTRQRTFYTLASMLNYKAEKMKPLVCKYNGLDNLIQHYKEVGLPFQYTTKEYKRVLGKLKYGDCILKCVSNGYITTINSNELKKGYKEVSTSYYGYAIVSDEEDTENPYTIPTEKEEIKNIEGSDTDNNPTDVKNTEKTENTEENTPKTTSTDVSNDEKSTETAFKGSLNHFLLQCGTTTSKSEENALEGDSDEEYEVDPLTEVLGIPNVLPYLDPTPKKKKKKDDIGITEDYNRLMEELEWLFSLIDSNKPKFFECYQSISSEIYYSNANDSEKEYMDEAMSDMYKYAKGNTIQEIKEKKIQ